jgi:hypothetical protein
MKLFPQQNTLGVARFQSCSVPLRLQQEADSLNGTRKRTPQKILLIIKQAESGLHLMSVALEYCSRLLGPLRAWYRRWGAQPLSAGSFEPL